jgi:hypothetical protein
MTVPPVAMLVALAVKVAFGGVSAIDVPYNPVFWLAGGDATTDN